MAKNNRFGQAQVLTQKELDKIRKELKTDHHRMFWDIARFTGERWGAICQLTIADIWAAGGGVRQEITFRKHTRKATAKGKQFTRQCPMHEALKELLTGKMPIGKFPTDWLFPSPRSGDRPISFSSCDKWLRSAVASAGLYHRGISTHTTRRTFITRLYNNGVDIKTLMAITGHADIKSLQRYIDVDQNRVFAAIATL
jgi:integrase/recombinase XerD